MLHKSGNYDYNPMAAAGGVEQLGSFAHTPSPLTGGISNIGSGRISANMSEQLSQMKKQLVSIIHDDLMEKVDDSVIQRLLKISEQLESMAAAPRRTSIPILQPPSAAVSIGFSKIGSLDSPKLSPNPMKAVVRDMDLNEIPLVDVGSNGGSTENTPALQPLSQGGPRRIKSVAFFKQQDAIGGINCGSEEEGQKFVSRAYSGFGSFRMSSRAASIRNGTGGLQEIRQRALSFHAGGMPVFDLGGNDNNGIRSRFSRPIARHTEVFTDPTPFLDACTSASLLDIDVSVENLNLLAVDAEEADVLRTVAVNVFACYRCMSPDFVDPSVFLQFIDAVSRYNNVTNPFRNGIHTADTLLAVHHYLRQQNVSNNYTDSEITSLLIAALCVNLGFLGVTNEFLLQLNHPLSRIFSVVSTAESVATMIGLKLLEQYNFLAPTCNTKDVYWLGIQEGITDLLNSISPRWHQSQLREAVAVMERGFVADADVPTLLSCVLRASTMRFCCQPKQQHIRYAELWVNEAYKQSECERIMGFGELPQWTNDTAWASVQTFVTVVAMPYFEALHEFLPNAWADNMVKVAALYGSEDEPVANNTASFRDGTSGLLSIEVDPNVPEWSDQSSLTLNILTTIIPQHLLAGSTGGRIGTAGRNRMDHYYSFLQLYDASEKDVIRSPDFGGSLVQLAMRLDPLYIGEYASALVDEEEWGTFADAAAMIMKTEVTPDTSSVMSPARKSFQSTDSFILLLLRMMHDRINGAGIMSGVNGQMGRSSAGSGNGSFSGSGQGYSPSGAGAAQGPFRGKWRLTTSNSVYDKK